MAGKIYKLGDFLTPYRIEHRIRADVHYRQVTVSKYGKVSLRGAQSGRDIGRKRQFWIDLKTYPNTVIFTRQGLFDGAIGIVPADIDGCTVTENMPTMSINTAFVDVEYLRKLLVSEYLMDKVRKLSLVGSAQKSIHERDLLKVEVLIPDVRKQKEVAKRLLSFDMHLLAIADEISRQEELAGRLRRQILQEAVEGRLTAVWRRRKRKSAGETAAALLARIQAEKQAQIQRKKLKQQKPLPPVQDSEKPFRLPQGWAWCRLGEISTYGIKKSVEPASGINHNAWILDLEDIEKGTSRLIRRMTYKDRPSKSTKSIFAKGDVLYGKLRPYLDKVIVAEEDGFCTTEIMPIGLFGGLNPYFIRLALKSRNFLEYANGQVSGMRMPRLGMESGRKALVPLPPLAEQQAIVEQTDRLMSLCGELEARIAESKAAAACLMQAALRETFSR